MSGQSSTLHAINTSTPRPGSCIHDTNLVNEVGARLKKAAAITDLIVNCPPDVLSSATFSDAAWQIYDLIEESRELVCAKHPEAQP